MNENLHRIEHTADVCVVGGGMAGLIAAVAAARRGSRVVLIHDRPVLGGNASSEVRMWICGAHGQDRKETGLLEEIQLLNLSRNPSGLYSVWDSVLFEYALMTPGLTTLLNCTVNDATVEDGHLTQVQAWQLTTQTWHTVNARFFVDSSGDSILAPLSGAETSSGRESRAAFDEPIAPLKADDRTMGNTLLIQLEETPSPQFFTPPNWAYHFGDDSNLPARVGQGFGHNFWWLELGGLQDTIHEAEEIRTDLLKIAWGVWDYMKNRGPQADRLRNWRMRWLGALPGKRENRRYAGPHILTQHDLERGGNFDDVVAYGGWSMDDHHPAGLLYPGKATIFHPAPTPYGIPLRSLYSRNIPNLFCAGRNISVTHAALSSTRVMGTTSVIGQAVGTAAALCVRESCLPRDLVGGRLRRLQQQLIEDDCWLPGQTLARNELMREARFSNEANASLLADGWERDWEGANHAVELAPDESISFSWETLRRPGSLRLVFDSDMNDFKRMPCRYRVNESPLGLPKQLVRDYLVEGLTESGNWEPLHEQTDNFRRLQIIRIEKPLQAIRFTGRRSWGDGPIRLFAFDAHPDVLPATESPPPGASWAEMIASQDPADLAPPDHGLEECAAGSGRVGA